MAQEHPRLPPTLAECLRLLETRHPRSIDLGLDRVARVWRKMHCPMPSRRVVTVAGTNGKGSTTAYIDAMLRALGYRCGSYTSPHLFHYGERVQVLGKPATDQQLLAAFERVEAARADISLSYFEFGTLAAFDLMARCQLDFAVLEVGLGGRLDAVNILDTDCAVITPIGLDHQEYLGADREAIGFEKAGILRPGKPLICGDRDPPHTVLEQAANLNAPVWRLGRDFRVSGASAPYFWQLGSMGLELPQPPLAGRHQVDNMANAVAAVVRLVPAAEVDPLALAQGLATVQLAGRLQSWPGCTRVWLDVGHNQHAATAIASGLEELGLKPRFCVLGMLRDKDAAAVAAALDPHVDTWFCTGLEGDRGRSGDELAREVRGVAGNGRVRSFRTVGGALSKALLESAPEENILVLGSFHTVAQAAEFLAGNC